MLNQLCNLEGSYNHLRYNLDVTWMQLGCIFDATQMNLDATQMKLDANLMKLDASQINLDATQVKLRWKFYKFRCKIDELGFNSDATQKQLR